MQQSAFEDIKKAKANTLVLTYYDLEKPVTIQTDISDVGVGAVPLQNGKPVSYASRVWNDCKKTTHQLGEKKRVESCCVLITQVQQLLLQKTCNNSQITNH